MNKELQKQVELHLATFPERHHDTLEMRKEWQEFKSKALWIMVGFVASVLAVGVWVGTIQSNIDEINADHSKLDVRYSAIEQRLGILEVNNGEIRTRLAAIEASLLEIKASILQIR